MSGNGQLFVTPSWLKNQLRLYLFLQPLFLSTDANSDGHNKVGGFCVGFSIQFCLPWFAGLKSHSQKVLQGEGGIGLGSTPCIASAIPYDVSKYRSNCYI